MYVSVKYADRDLYLRTPALSTPWGVNFGFKGTAKEPAKAGDKNDKVAITLFIDENKACDKQFVATMDFIKASIKKHVQENAAVLFGPLGAGLSGSNLKDAIKDAKADDRQKYYLGIYTDEKRAGRAIKLPIPPWEVPITDLATNKTVKVSPKDQDAFSEVVPKESTVYAVFKASRFFLSADMIAHKFDVVSMGVRRGQGGPVASPYDDVVDVQVKVEEEVTEAAPKKRKFEEEKEAYDDVAAQDGEDEY